MSPESTGNSGAMERLLELMRCLRDPEHGCRWDLKQDMESLTSHTLEEVYEVIDAVENGSVDEIRGELGDLLFQIVFYARIAEERGWFDFAGVADDVFRKLLHRHPHVFPDGRMESFGQAGDHIDPAQVESNWEAIKNAERERDRSGPVSVMDDVPRALPSLMRARKLQKRAASRGFDWPDASAVLDKVQEELDELREAVSSGDEFRQESELGDLLFTCVNLSRHLGQDPERAVRACNDRFEQRFRAMECIAGEQDTTLDAVSPALRETWWEKAKSRESGGR